MYKDKERGLEGGEASDQMIFNTYQSLFKIEDHLNRSNEQVTDYETGQEVVGELKGESEMLEDEILFKEVDFAVD